MAMLDWNKYRRQLAVRIGEIAKLSPDTARSYQALTASNGESRKCAGYQKGPAERR
jgi:hypothetical protein